jgi:hypothetical protein
MASTETRERAIFLLSRLCVISKSARIREFFSILLTPPPALRSSRAEPFSLLCRVAAIRSSPRRVSRATRIGRLWRGSRIIIKRLVPLRSALRIPAFPYAAKRGERSAAAWLVLWSVANLGFADSSPVSCSTNREPLRGVERRGSLVQAIARRVGTRSSQRRSTPTCRTATAIDRLWTSRPMTVVPSIMTGSSSAALRLRAAIRAVGATPVSLLPTQDLMTQPVAPYGLARRPSHGHGNSAVIPVG